MRQVRVWLAGWIEIASGAESVFMGSRQSTDRPVGSVGQSPVWPRKSDRLAVPPDDQITDT